ncbi:MAG: penicillin-binding protein 2 [Chlorobiales bacterium]|nr:penicillin-binding protein 2 [Chlorobiales bacterium]
MNNRQLSFGIVYIGVTLVFLLLLARLYFLQVVSQSELGEISNQNSVRRIQVDAPRGIMYDRNGIPVVDNRPLYSVQLVPAEFSNKNIPLLASVLGMTEDDVRAKINEGVRYNRFASIKIMRDVNFKVLGALEETLWRLPGVDFVVENKRKYLDSVRGSHMFGYTKIVSKDMLEKLPKDSYAQDDIIGYSGIEKTYESFVRGKKGERYVMVNSVGKIISKYENGTKDDPPQRGRDLYLTMDAGLQSVAESLLTATGKSGGIVAIDPRNGEVLALVSEPDYDLNAMSGFTNLDTWKEISLSPLRPLFNRAIQTRYPPGSTYKMILSLAALEEKVATPSTSFYCPGYFTYGNKRFGCHGSHGQIDMVRAIEQSCNTYFFNLMFRVGHENWAKYGEMFGIGHRTGIDLPDERTAPIPNKAYFDKRYGPKGWTPGYLVSLAIGQGEVGASPLQMAAYVATIANKGTYYQPHLVRSYRDQTTRKAVPIEFEKRKLPISENTFDVVRHAMKLVVESGTARLAQVPNVEVAGKTGTAQNTHGEDHAWFICFAPYENPTIAIAVLVENAGFGGTIAAPIAREMMKYYLTKNSPNLQANSSNPNDIAMRVVPDKKEKLASP